MLTTADAIAGAGDILAEAISDEADYRSYIRKATFDEGQLLSEAKDEKAQTVYEMYYHYEEPVKKAAGHRILALNRGEAEKVLTVPCGSAGGAHFTLSGEEGYCAGQSAYDAGAENGDRGQLQPSDCAVH